MKTLRLQLRFLIPLVLTLVLAALIALPLMVWSVIDPRVWIFSTTFDL